MRLPVTIGTLLSVALSVSACSEKDKDKCDEALRVSRQSIDIGNGALARQWRDRAYKYCADGTALNTLDADIVKKEQEETQKRAAEEARKAEATQLVSLFTDWVGKNRAAPDRAAANVTCRGDEEKKERWCEGQRKVGEKYTFSVLYWEADPEAAQFKTRVPNALECAALGEHRLLKSFNVEATKRSYCEISSGPLSGMKSVVSSVPTEAEAKVFTAKYLDRDANLKAQVGQ
jgi:hypothetical protein